ncbi:M50 family metallopeptidase [Brachybacterium hainanense]|uniref:M50 family metallopeptidase n=1 Tax=Brachybacterium hainanense TaxID=1541174 RepID=A0ABV6RBA4_9MICO
MKQPELRLGSLPPLRISPGTLVTIAVLALLVHPAITRVDGIGPATAVAVAVGIGLFMIVSVAVHELAHTLAALAFGAKVDHIALTLWGGHTQYSGGRLRSWHGVVISLVGPLSNAVLGAAAALADPLAERGSAAAAFLFFASSLNYALAAFNLLPGLPMDGGRALEGVLGALTRRPLLATRITAWTGRVIAAAVVVYALGRTIRDPGGADLLLVLWAVLIGGMLWQGAGAALAQAQMESRVERADLGRLLRPVRLLPADAPLTAIGPDVDPGSLLVLEEAAGFGLVDARALDAVPMERRPQLPVRAVMTSLPRAAQLTMPLSGAALVSAMLARPFPLYVVRGPGGEVLGTVASADVDAHLRGR